MVPVLEQLLAQASTSEAMETSDCMPRLRSDALRQSTSAPTAPSIDDQPGEQVGPYRLLRVLGTGGMGTVWLAERPDRVIERHVALKLPRAEWTDRSLADRMARERSVLASLNHPNIAQLFDAGWAGDGRPYLALEYIEGEPIDAWCRRKQLAPAARMRLFVDVVRAVAFAHAKLVIHRDLKPSNVLVTEEGRVKLLDFGIAKLLSADASLTEETALTRFAGRALTLNYAAPEQVLGQPISTAADTYALGVMLFELMSGERPYRVQRDSRGALEDAIVNAEIPAPSSVTTDKATARVLRGDLDTIILKALRKQPEQRYETAAAFADDIERWLDQRPVRAQRASNWYRTRRFLLRHRLGAITGVITFSALLVGGSIALWQWRSASEESARADTVRDFVLSIIAQADPAASRETRAADLTLLTTAESRLARELGVRPALALELRVAIASAYRNRGEFDRAGATLRNAINEARKALPANDLNLMRAWVRIADWQIMDDDEVVRELDSTIEAARQLGRRGAEVLVDGLTARARVRHLWQGRHEAAVADAREAHAIALLHFGSGHVVRLGAALTLAVYLEGFGAALAEEIIPLAESAYAAALANADLGVAHPKRIEIQSWYGAVLCVAGRGHEGLDLLRNAVKVAREHHGDGLPTENALVDLFNGFATTGDARAALESAKEAFTLAAAREPVGAFNRAIRADLVIWMLINNRRTEEAGPMRQEFSAHVATLPEGHVRKRTPRWQDQRTIWLLNYAGDTAAAEAFASDALAKYEELGWKINAIFIRLGWSFALRQNGKAAEAEAILIANNDPRLTRDSAGGYLVENSLGELAATRLALGDAADAYTLADRAIKIALRPRLQTDPDLSDLYVTQGRALLQLNRPAEALESLHKAHEFWQDFNAQSNWAAEAAYWYGQALIANGDAIRGQQWVRQMQPRLAKSSLPLHRALATSAASRG